MRKTETFNLGLIMAIAFDAFPYNELFSMINRVIVFVR